jgi:hypothetical protein
MSNKAQSTDLALQIEKEIAAQAAAIADTLPESSGFNISTEGKMFTLPNGKSHPGPMEVVILDYINYNCFYKTAWKQGEYSPPACWSLNKNPKIMVPSENAPEKQNDTCRGCPKAEWGSHPNGRGGKACTNYVKLAITPAADIGPNSDVMILRVAPKGLAGWRTHVQRIQEATGSTPISVVSSISFNPNEVYPNLMFDVAGKLESDDLSAAYGLFTQAKQLVLNEPEVDKS